MNNIDLVNELKAIFNENLVSVLTYGEDSHIIAIFGKLEASDLKKAFPAIKKWKKTKKLLPVVMSEDEWCSSADIYPIEYTIIKNSYETLYGKDIVSCLNVKKPDLRLKCEYEIKNILVRIRELYLGNSDNPKFIIKILEENFENLMRILKAVLCLFDMPVTGSNEEIIRQLAEKTDFDGEVFVEILSAKASNKKFSSDEIEGIIQRAINAINTLYGFIDKLPCHSED